MAGLIPGGNPAVKPQDETPGVGLRVSEALPKDVGRGIARIDPADIAELGAEVGEIVEIQGKRATVAKLMPAYPGDRGKKTIQVDGVVRANAQVGLDERVTARRVTAAPARKLVLQPVAKLLPARTERDRKYIGRLLEGLAVVPGDRIRATLFGSRWQDFTVVDTSPRQAVVIQPTTEIKLQEPSAPGEPVAKVSYEDIGGLGVEIRRIREMIELPLKHPEVFERLGIDPPKGVLLHGPPGCGKTLIARAVAGETDAYFVHINGPEIIHKFYGESEAKLRAKFEEARKHTPSIIFLDEIDAIAPKRAEVTGEVEKRVVSQLLALMDGLEQRGHLIVIGATNIPNSLDPALRRPGRFDREIAIRIPDQNGRLDILQIHTRGMPLSEDVNLERLARITHGFVGADLKALAQEAAMTSLRKLLPEIDFDLNQLPYEELLALEVGMDDFLEALKEVEPSAIREVFVEVPDVRWEQVGGLSEAKEALREAIEWPLRYDQLFARANVSPPRGILLTGRPGTGKTMLAKAVASQTELNFIAVKGPELVSKWVGEAERAIREIFKKAKQASPCVLFFDEIDSIAPARGAGGGDSHVAERMIAQFLTELDGVEELKGVVVLGATNRPDIIDPALLRPGRFDLVLELPEPDEAGRLEIFRVHTAGKPLAPEVDLEPLASRAQGFVGADIEAVCRRAAMAAIREHIAGGHAAGGLEDFRIFARHFEEAVRYWEVRSHGK